MRNRWRHALSLLSLLCIAAPQARSQIGNTATVVGAGAVETANETHHVRATLGQSGIAYALGEPFGAGLGFWHQIPRARTSAHLVEEQTTGSRTITLQASPNPFSESTRLSLRIAEPEHVTLVLYDLFGTPVRTMLDAEQPEGTYSVSLFADDLPSGGYTLTVTAGNERRTIPLLLVR